MLFRTALLVLVICPGLLGLGVVLAVRVFLSVTTIQGYSMYPTLHPGDRLLVLRRWPDRWLRRGQIVIGDLEKVEASFLADQPFVHIEPPAEKNSPLGGTPKKFVKRLIGLPGDTICIPLSQLPDVFQDALSPRADAQGNLVWQIPSGHCFVRGDGMYSGDSVIWGPIPLRLIRGISLCRLFSQSEADPESAASILA